MRIITPDGTEHNLAAHAGQRYTEVLFEAGLVENTPLCAGTGRCGMCRIRFEQNPPRISEIEEEVFSWDELCSGWRLACRHVVSESQEIFFPFAPSSERLPRITGKYLAVDIGTTRIKWSTGQALQWSDEYALLNPQMGVGSEIVTRLQFALSSRRGRNLLRKSLIDKIRLLVHNTRSEYLCVTGNSVMMSLLCDAELESLARAPYALSFQAGCDVRIASDLPATYIPPLLGPFIGADISAGLTAICRSCNPTYPFFLIDLGTNGEFVLAVDEGHFHCASIPMGPAIEGVGLSCGKIAGEHVITEFELAVRGLQWQPQSPNGISGTGYISLLAILRRLGVIDRAGHFVQPSCPLGRRLAERVDEDAKWGRRLRISTKVALLERDIEEFLKVKAGLSLAVNALLGSVNLDISDIAHVYLAGALGEYADLRDLMTLGFFSELWSDRIVRSGNTSLTGARLLLDNIQAKEWCERLPQATTILSLVDQSDFGSRFVEHMHFS